MKIGILTYHQANNFGAALQAFALVEYLKSIGYEVEIINYISSFLSDKYNDKRMVNRRGKLNGLSFLKMVLSKPMLKKRSKLFNEFRSTMSISKQKYNERNIYEANFDYNFFIAGSDQIWNHELSNSDATYMLSFVKSDAKKMSYASSFGMESIEESMVDFYREHLKGIKIMSVREKTGAAIVHELLGRVPEVVLDPCLLLDKNEWINHARNSKPIKTPYILVYMFTGSNLGKVLSGTNLDFSKYTIVKVNGNITFKDFINKNTKVKFGIGPREFLDLIINADIVITDSFHGTVFSVIFEKRFVTVLRENKGKNSRVLDFLEPIGLGDRIYNDNMNSVKLLETPDYTRVKKELEKRIEHSKRFIIDSLKAVEMKDGE